MLRVDVRELARGPVETKGELAPDDPLWEGADLGLKEPVLIGGRLQAISDGRYYWHGRVRAVVQGECRRCLVPVETPLELDVGALFTQDPEALEDPDSYPVDPDATEVDLTPAVREELVLAAPRYALCREDCKGLCPQCGRELNTGPCGCAPVTEERWQPLKALKDKLRS